QQRLDRVVLVLLPEPDIDATLPQPLRGADPADPPAEHEDARAPAVPVATSVHRGRDATTARAARCRPKRANRPRARCCAPPTGMGRQTPEPTPARRSSVARIAYKHGLRTCPQDLAPKGGAAPTNVRRAPLLPREYSRAENVDPEQRVLFVVPARPFAEEAHRRRARSWLRPDRGRFGSCFDGRGG